MCNWHGNQTKIRFDDCNDLKTLVLNFRAGLTLDARLVTPNNCFLPINARN